MRVFKGVFPRVLLRNPSHPYNRPSPPPSSVLIDQVGRMSSLLFRMQQRTSSNRVRDGHDCSGTYQTAGKTAAVPSLPFEGDPKIKQSTPAIISSGRGRLAERRTLFSFCL